MLKTENLLDLSWRLTFVYADYFHYSEVELKMWKQFVKQFRLFYMFFWPFPRTVWIFFSLYLATLFVM